jgi:hypothetical protein
VTNAAPEGSIRTAPLLILLILALAIRVGWGFSRPADDASLSGLPDQREYLSLSRNLLHGRGLQFLDNRFNDSARAFRTPGYPLFIAACGGSVRTVRAAQALLDTSTVLAVFLLTRLFVRGRPGPLLAAMTVAFNPYLIYFAGLLLSETLFTAMLAWGMFLLANGSIRGLHIRSLQWLFGGALLALSILVRPSAVALPVLLGILSVFLNRSVRPAYDSGAPDRPPSRVPPGVAMVLLTLACLFPWAIRNRIAVGHWIWLDTNSGFTLYDGYNPDAAGASDQSFVDRLPELQVLDEVQRDQYLAQKAADYAQSHPRRVWSLFWAKLARTWSPVPLSEQYGRAGLRLIALAYSIPFDILILIALFCGKISGGARAFLIGPAVYFSIIHALTVGSLRYRIPAEPLLAVLIAGLAASGAMPWRRTQFNGSAPVPADNLD